MKRYDKYKPSNVKWIGEIPEHWEVKRLKYVAKVQSSNVDKKSLENELKVSLCNYMDVYKNEFITASFNFMKATARLDEINKFSVHEGDVLVTKDSETPDDIANPAVVKEKLENVICGYHLAQIRSDKNILNSDFLFRLFQVPRFNDQFKVGANGVTRYGLSISKIADAFVPLPPINEQLAIANYLNDKTAKIDSLIKKKKKLIELLKKERAAVINKAVTYGINPNVNLKESGIDWLGEVPEHWEVKKLRYLGRCQNGVSKGAEYFGAGSPFMGYGDVYNNEETPLKVSGLAQSSEQDRVVYSVNEGDIFFTRTSETIDEIGIASTCMKTLIDATFSGFLIRVRPEEDNIHKGYSKYYFRCQKHRNFFVKEMNLVTRASLSQDLLKRLPVLLPPVAEQKQIFNYLETETKRIDETISKIEKEIELLVEYRTALISEVVTGKIRP